MRRCVQEGDALGLFVEGTRQRSGVPVMAQPGAAMVALQERVPIVPAAIHGSQFWKPGNFEPVSVAWGRPLYFDGLPANGKGTARPRSRSSARSTAWRFLVDAHALGRRATRRHPRERAPWPPELAGTAAIVGFPNVGKSTLVNRLTETRDARRPPDAGRDARPRSSFASGAETVPARRHRRCRPGRPLADHPPGRGTGSHRDRGSRSRPLRRRRPDRRHAGRRGSGRFAPPLRAGPCS